MKARKQLLSQDTLEQVNVLNNFKQAMGDNYSMTTDGMKVIVCRLKSNAMGYDSTLHTQQMKCNTRLV